MEFYVWKVEEKLALLKALHFEVSPDPISETALELEQLADIEHISDAMWRAYWAMAVAVELMLSRIRGRDRELELLSYEMSRMVERVRRGRMEELGSELLADWNEVCETEVWNDDVRECFLRRYEGSRAGEWVMMFMRAEMEKM